ncbi:MAG: DNA-directed RNA polymerase subunit omega [Nitrospirota bacterium]|nr:DNA-directed RNA polymerase subunit omega [Nitrospirota bacterium]
MDIISLPVEYDHKKIDGKFRLVAIASQRAKELSLGAKPKVSTKSKKVTTIAIEETIENKLDFVTGEEAVIAREKAGKFDYRKQIEESRKIAAGEDLTELEKDLKVYLHEKGAYDKKAFEELFTDKKGEDTGEAEE